MKISNEGVQITQRFFKVIDLLIHNNTIRGLQTFTEIYNINRWNLITVRNNPTTRVIKPEWIYYLCKEYNISTDYIIFGKGPIFKSHA